MDLAAIADELYALPRTDFVAARNERAKLARAQDDKMLATSIGGFAKPSAAAWVVNLLARHAREELEQLLELGGRMRRAQGDGAGPELRRLMGEQNKLLTRVGHDGRVLASEAGQSIGNAIDVQVVQTLRAAMADPEAAGAVLSGQLVRDLDSPGFGPVDVADAIAVRSAAKPYPAGPTGRPHLRVVPDDQRVGRSSQRPASPPRSSGRVPSNREREKAERAAKDAEAEAEAEAERSARDLADAQRNLDELDSRIADLGERKEHVEAELRFVSQETRNARGEREALEHKRMRAERRAAKSQQAAERTRARSSRLGD